MDETAIVCLSIGLPVFICLIGVLAALLRVAFRMGAVEEKVNNNSKTQENFASETNKELRNITQRIDGVYRELRLRNGKNPNGED